MYAFLENKSLPETSPVFKYTEETRFEIIVNSALVNQFILDADSYQPNNNNAHGNVLIH